MITHVEKIINRWYQTVDQALLAHGATPETLKPEDVRWLKYLDRGQEQLIAPNWDSRDQETHVYEEVFYHDVLVARLSRRENSFKTEMFVPDQERAL